MKALLETERLVLRNLCAADCAALLDYRNNPLCAQYQHWEDTSEAFLQVWIARFSSCRLCADEREQHYALCLRSGAMIGDVTVFADPDDPCYTLGITLSYRHQRQGYGYEALKALINRLHMEQPRWDTVALIDRDNAASIRLFQKLGFEETGYAASLHSYCYTLPGKVEPRL